MKIKYLYYTGANWLPGWMGGFFYRVIPQLWVLQFGDRKRLYRVECSFPVISSIISSRILPSLPHKPLDDAKGSSGRPPTRYLRNTQYSIYTPPRGKVQF